MKIIFILFLFLKGQAANACSCGSSGEFLTVAPETEFVALVKVTKYLTFKNIYDNQTPMSMEVEIIDVYKGEEKRKTIKVWGDNGILCRPYLSSFGTGKYFVIAFYKASDGSTGNVHKDERPTDYTISSCGDYWLNADVLNRKATGAVTNKQNVINLSDLKAKLSLK